MAGYANIVGASVDVMKHVSTVLYYFYAQCNLFLTNLQDVDVVECNTHNMEK